MGDTRVMRAVLVAALLGALAACGQKGPLYLPDQAREVVTRPAPSPDTQAPNTPQTVDSPGEPANPAPEVTAPPKDESKDEDKKEPDTTAPR